MAERRGFGEKGRAIVPLAVVLLAIVTVLAWPAWAQAPIRVDTATVEQDSLRFEGERALTYVRDFVTRFPNRASGRPANEASADYLLEHFASLGAECIVDRWQVVNYGAPVELRNVVCELSGSRAEAIVLVAHHDASPAAVQAADNDGSGIGVLMHLAEVLAAEPQRRYGLVFLAADGEEYGMLGTRRFVSRYGAERLLAGVSLDNLGKFFYDGLDIDGRGQFRGYAPLWLQRLVQDAAVAAGEATTPRIAAPIDQLLAQAIPISFMDEGPLVAAGVPAVGLAGHVPPEFAQLHWDTYHNPDDTLVLQAAEPLGHVGRVTEALVAALQAAEAVPYERGPYLLTGAGRVVRGTPLRLVFATVVAAFALIAALRWRAALRAGESGWIAAVTRLASLWLALLASVGLLYLLVALGMLDAWELYPATSKDPALTSPRWPGLVAWAVGTAIALWTSWRLAGWCLRGMPKPCPRVASVLSFTVLSAAAAAIATTVPFALIFVVPTLAWTAIGARQRLGRLADVALLLSGGAVVFAMLYVMGFQVLRIGPYILWYLAMMFSGGMIAFPAAALIVAIVAAGLALVVPRYARR